MRLLAATISALLMSVSQPVLSQENDGVLPQGEWQQSEHQQIEPQQQVPGEPQAEMEQPVTEQAEMQPVLPEPEAQQVEMQQQPTQQPVAEQAEMQTPAASEPETRQVEMQQPAARAPQPQQAEIQQPMPQPATPQVEMQSPAAPEPQPQQAETPQPATPESQIVTGNIRQQPATPETQADIPNVALPRDAKWTVFQEPSLGTRMDLPSAVFTTSDGVAYRGVGRQYKTADGRAAVAIYSQRNSGRDTPSSYLRKNFVFPRAAVAYQRVTRDFFAVSGVTDGMIFYSRCNVSPTGGTLHCFDVKYPAGEKTAWDAIVTRMSRSLRPLNRS